jgi:hypothetical protein
MDAVGCDHDTKLYDNLEPHIATLTSDGVLAEPRLQKRRTRRQLVFDEE